MHAWCEDCLIGTSGYSMPFRSPVARDSGHGFHTSSGTLPGRDVKIGEVLRLAWDQ